MISPRAPSQTRKRYHRPAWRRKYFWLLLVRLYFALSPSYLHPDENFQGPEVIAGQVFSYPVKLTWEFTSEHPVRSIFPLWIVYGLPMLLLRWIWIGNGNDGEVTPVVVFRTLRVLMFVLSFVLEDWAILELSQLQRHKETALLLVASSYVTWTYQMHTFSNSIETLLVAWCLVLIQKIVEDKQRTSPLASSTLAFLVVFGVFNRITFPAFLFIPGLRLIPHFAKKPLSLIFMAVTALCTLFFAVSLDTDFYTSGRTTLLELFTHPVLTPVNNFTYNISKSNLALHGLHPWYQHILSNLPLLIGPAFILLFLQPHTSPQLYAAISGVIFLSLFQHQEARFLLPAVPLILTSLKLPQKKTLLRAWVGAWITFNVIFGILMGIYHQGGVIPAQVFLSQRGDANHAMWWKTYSPPIWLLNGKSETLKTHDAMGMKGDLMMEELRSIAPCYTLAGNKSTEGQNGTYLVAPISATFLDQYTLHDRSMGLRFNQVWSYRRHLNLDDLDFGDDGIWPTIQRVVGRRGLAIWKVAEDCSRQHT